MNKKFGNSLQIYCDQSSNVETRISVTCHKNWAEELHAVAMDSCSLRTGLGSCHAGFSFCASWAWIHGQYLLLKSSAAIRNCHKWWTQGLPSSSEARGNNGCRGELTNEVKTVEVKEDSGITEKRSYFNRRSDSISLLRWDQFKLIMGRSGSF